jgi:hypothetical protein
MVGSIVDVLYAEIASRMMGSGTCELRSGNTERVHLIHVCQGATPLSSYHFVFVIFVCIRAPPHVYVSGRHPKVNEAGLIACIVT